MKARFGLGVIFPEVCVYAGLKKQKKTNKNKLSAFSFFLQESNPGNLTSVSTPNLLSAGVCLFFFFLNNKCLLSIVITCRRLCMEHRLPLACFINQYVSCSCLLSWTLAQKSFRWLADVLGLEMLTCFLISLSESLCPSSAFLPRVRSLSFI